MRILVVAATISEIEPFQTQNSSVDFLVSGVGMIAATYHLTAKLQETKFDYVVNAGIAGAFDKQLKIGDVVEVKTDQFSEFGIEDDEQFLSVFESKLVAENEFPYQSSKLINPDAGISNLPLVHGITVNAVHGNESSIRKVKSKFNPDVESMEGAAIAYVCLQQNIKFVQIRAISNYVEKRNKEAWNIPLAIANLNNGLTKLLGKLEQKLP